MSTGIGRGHAENTIDGGSREGLRRWRRRVHVSLLAALGAAVQGCASIGEPGIDPGTGASTGSPASTSGTVVPAPAAGTRPAVIVSATTGRSDLPTLGRQTDSPYDLVAIDLVRALAQTNALGDATTPVLLPPATTPFATALENALIAYPFLIERANTRTAEGVLMSSVVQESAAGAEDRYTFIVATGRVALKRTYQLRERYVAPVSSLFVRGAEPDSIRLNDIIFLQGGFLQGDPIPSDTPPGTSVAR